jgi:hypothetical protein
MESGHGSAWRRRLSCRGTALALALCLGSWMAPASLFGQPPPPPHPPPAPQVAILYTGDDGQLHPGLPPVVLIGETFHFKLRVSPDPSATGYGPFVELYLDLQGADCNATKAAPERCDGVSFVSAEEQFTTSRRPLMPCPPVAFPFAFPVGPACTNGSSSLCPGTTPVAPSPSTCFFGVAPPSCESVAGYQKVVLPLTFGSFEPTQPQVLVDVAVKVDSFANEGIPLTIKARGGFQYAGDLMGTQPPSIGPICPVLMASATTTPHVIRVHKKYLGPEDETATGPDFPVTYQITVDVADGQTVNDLLVFECLPDSLVYLSSTAPGASFNSSFNCLTVNYPSLTGGSSHPDASFTFDAYVPDVDFIGQPVLGPSCKTVVDNRVEATAQWKPLDPRELGPLTVSAKDDHPITAKCIALQKTVQEQVDTGAPGPTPGDTLLYRLDFEISDFKTFQGIVLDDYLADGLVVGTPTLTVSDKFGGKSGFITPVQSIHPGVYTCNDGTTMFQPTHLHFDISSALETLDPAVLRHFHGILTGGRAGLPPGGPATGTIFFRARIADRYLRQPVTPRNVKKDDTLPNCAVISGNLAPNADGPALPPPLDIGTGDDDSLAKVTIVTGILRKSIFEINGHPPPSPPLVSPGDFVTFRLELPIPSTDAAALSFDDFLPSPMFDLPAPLAAPKLCTFQSLKFSATGTVTPLSLAVCPPFAAPTPTLTPQPADNSLHIEYGTLDDPGNTPRSVDLLLTLQATGVPFVDGLHFTNHVLESEQNSFGVTFEQTEVAELVLGEPKLRIRKGVVAADDSKAVFTPQPSSPVFFNRPGKLPAFTGVIDSANVGTGLNSDVSNVDGCDRLRFVVAVENIGSSPKGAFDVTLHDLLPPCLRDPSNLRVANGLGAPLRCKGNVPCSTSDFFSATGITLEDPSPSAGALAAYSPTAGTNIAIVTFDASIPCNITAKGCCTNTAELLNYAGVPGGPNHTKAKFSTPFPDTTPDPKNPFVDAAKVCVQPGLTKSIVVTSEPSTPGHQVTIGEVVRYQLQIALPVGVSPGLTLTDTLPAGMVWMPGCTVTAAPQVPPLTFSSGFPPVVSTPFTPTLSVNFGTVTNPPFGPNGALLTVTCNALVLNSSANQAGAVKPNSFTVTLHPSSGPVSFTSSSVSATIIEPAGALAKQEIPAATPTQVGYGLSYTNNGTATAFDVDIHDPLPAPLTVATGVTVSTSSSSFSCTVNSPPPTDLVDVTCPKVPPGGTVTITFAAAALPLCVSATNQATLTYTSLPGPHGTVPNPTGAFPPGASGAPRGERVYSSSASAVSLHCPDLAIQKSHDVFNLSPFTSPAVSLGGNFALTVTNVGNTPSVPPATVTDVLPKGLLCSKAGGGGWACTCSSSSQTVTCTRTTPILPNESSSIPIAVVLSGSDPGPYTNCASVATTADINPNNNTSCVVVPFCIDFPDASQAIPNMISWFPFDETAGTFTLDFVNGAGGLFVPPGGPSSPQRTPGMVAGALCFNSPGSYVDVQVPPGPDDLGASDLTIDTWVKTNANSGIQPILDKRQASSAGLAGYNLFLFNGLVAFQMADGPGSTDCSTDPSSACTNWSAPPGTGVADGNWHHITVTVVRNQKDGGTFYVDCVRVGTFDPTVRPGNLNNSAHLWLAAEYNIGGSSAPAETLSGCLDELEIFNRALSLQEIQAFCTAGAYGKCKFKAH